jgi:hypothetical protein
MIFTAKVLSYAANYRKNERYRVQTTATKEAGERRIGTIPLFTRLSSTSSQFVLKHQPKESKNVILMS